MQKPAMRVTMKDVADDANVSLATVSHVLNNTRKVSDEVARRVHDSVSRLNYYPNHVVGSIRRKRTNTVGLLIPSIANETLSRIADYIQEILFNNGFNLIVYCSKHDSAVEERALRSMLMNRVDAIFAIPSSLACPALLDVRDVGIPVILLDRELADCKFDTIRCNNYQGEYMAVNYLIRMGHRNIGYVDRMVELSHSVDQRRGFLDALRDNGLEANSNHIVSAHGHYYHAGIEAAQSLMLHAPEITAIACYYDLIAFGVIRGLLELGFHVPDDISVIGYDNMVFTEATWPSLTTVDISIKSIAENACRLLMKRLEQKDMDDSVSQEPEIITLEPRLILRESVKRLSGPDALEHASPK